MVAPVEKRLADLDIAIGAAWALCESHRRDSFDGRKARALQMERIDKLLDIRLGLMCEQMVTHTPPAAV